ncbi:TlpA disulfide reductase family protein [Pedobacter sp. PLR]|uniref:TlpA disulfide reductase family protein n=1 Tax=Pedobacter sp. PLR TaxID=2994465 RepID=UPI0022457323|nr:TlpA disulfide reductase family protein [Pedobacter sp. PLR]MCX2452111.1 TlpA disulfide reductase family protein [Pedobacter sp. PLR]
MISFELNGKINVDTGTIKLVFNSPSDYYPEKKTEQTAKIINGEFWIEGKLPSPESFYLILGNQYRSARFVLEPGNQWININIDSNRKMPELDNQVMKEQVNINNFFKVFRQESALLEEKHNKLLAIHKNGLPPAIKLEMEKDMREEYHKSDQLLLAYVTKNPNSYISFWTLTHLMSFGYQDIFESIYPKFSDSLRNTYAGKVLAEKIQSAKVLGTGKQFPIINVKNNKGVNFTADNISKNQYTLIDFWYSGCIPCIETFPGLIEVRKKYQQKGFEIIGISVDKEKDKAKWLAAIKKYEIAWPHFLDKEGVESAKLSIWAFPQNYLLNQKGEIVGQNLKAAEIDDYLMHNMSK